MKTITILLIFASVLLLVGCAVPRAGYPSERLPVAPAAAPAPAVDDVAVITEDVGQVADLDEELGLDELEGIDKDLDLGL